jgi:signal transduction histidine kinase
VWDLALASDYYNSITFPTAAAGYLSRSMSNFMMGFEYVAPQGGGTMNIAADLETGSCERDVIETGAGGLASGAEPEFAATLAHEMRNLLAPLSVCLEVLDLPGVDEHSARQARAVMGRQVHQLQRLVNDLLDAHRLERHEIELVSCPLDLNELVRSVCEDHGPAFASRGVALCVQALDQPLWMEIDSDRLNQALNNLLHNSLKFTDHGGSVHIGLSLEIQRQRAVIFVRDTGVGIAPERLPAIFQNHSHDASNRNRSGLGLGLPLARRLVELHGGRLEASSAGLGHGAEFRILLPLERFLP